MKAESDTEIQEALDSLAIAQGLWYYHSFHLEYSGNLMD